MSAEDRAPDPRPGGRRHLLRRPRARRFRVDIPVCHPHDGRLLVTGRDFFADPSAEVCRQVLGRLLAIEEVRGARPTLGVRGLHGDESVR